MTLAPHLNPATTEELMPAFEAFIAALVEHYQPRLVIWFGSRARGQGDGWSDFDVLIVFDECPDQLKLAGQIGCALKPNFTVDIIPRDWKLTEDRMTSGCWFILDAFREGIVMHGEWLPGLPVPVSPIRCTLP